jgi:hypothetical protein
LAVHVRMYLLSVDALSVLQIKLDDLNEYTRERNRRMMSFR